MSAAPDWTLLDRYWSGECSAEDARAIEQWAAADPSHAELLASMHRVWREAATPVPAVDEARAWAALRARIAEAEREDEARRASPRRAVRAIPLRAPMHESGRAGWRVRAVAAAVVGAAGIGAVLAARHVAVPVMSGAVAAREYATARGQRAEVTLIDGTRVWLSVDSRLRVPQGYGATSRDVVLDGEAYFVVQHDARRPFRVHAHGSVSEDLGTEFSVRAYPSDTDAVVIVAAGRVALRAAGAAPSVRGAELRPGQMGRIDPAGHVTIADDVDLDALLAWRSGRLTFLGAPLTSVVRSLERWYDLEITIDDPALAGVPVDVTFGNESADEALTVLSRELDVRYTRDGRRVHIIDRHLSLINNSEPTRR
ncbi:MAG: FecR domain-containing protein, partial [Gemmatimonadaceae bacterium]|nr:FecR domain-containing protein [Gemmatimonadaceae bacterium]